MYPTPQDTYEPWPITSAQVLAIMGIPLPNAADTQWLDDCVAAVGVFVGRYKVINNLADESCQWAALQLSQRLYNRRGSSTGLQSYESSGMAYYVSNRDPDVAQRLRLGLPRIG